MLLSFTKKVNVTFSLQFDKVNLQNLWIWVFHRCNFKYHVSSKKFVLKNLKIFVILMIKYDKILAGGGNKNYFVLAVKSLYPCSLYVLQSSVGLYKNFFGTWIIIHYSGCCIIKFVISVLVIFEFCCYSNTCSVIK